MPTRLKRRSAGENEKGHIKKMAKKWKCVECGYIHEGEYPPDTCPVCYAPSDAFVEVAVNV